MTGLYRTSTVDDAAIFIVLIPLGACGLAQDLTRYRHAPRSRWRVFVDEIENPLRPGSAFFNATTSQLARPPAGKN